MRHECWTSQGSLSCSQQKSVCHDWTATDATHSCMPGCESILAVTASWLSSVCGFCLCGIRRWESYVWWFLGMKELLSLLQRHWVENRTNPLTWEVMWVYPPRQCFLRLCHRTHLYSTIWHSPDVKTHRNWTRFETARAWDCMQHKVVIPFGHFGITNQSHLQGSRCPRRICLDSRQPAHTWCLLEELTFTELIWWSLIFGRDIA
jgi:hypothetical protein